MTRTAPHDSTTVPLTGTDFLRLLTTALILPNELHTTKDQRRVFLENVHVAPVWHGTVADESAMIALNVTSERGCFPMDNCYRADTSSVWVCMTNRGAEPADWRNTNAGAAAAAAVGAKVSLASVFAVADETETAIEFDTEDLDSDGQYTDTAPSRLTARSDGLYGFGGWVRFAANATGFRRVLIRKGDGSVLAAQASMAITATGEPTDVAVMFECVLAENEYIELFAYQNSGGAVNVAVGSAAWLTKRGSAPVVVPDIPPSGELLINQIFETILEGDDIEQDILINQIFN